MVNIPSGSRDQDQGFRDEVQRSEDQGFDDEFLEYLRTILTHRPSDVENMRREVSGKKTRRGNRRQRRGNRKNKEAQRQRQ
jgi:hypothetical protein